MKRALDRIVPPSPSDGVVIVTGGATGIGLAITEELVEHGYNVVIGDIDDAAGSEASERIGVDSVRLNVAEEADWRRVAQHLGETRIIGLVNNAGVGGAGTVADETLDGWSHVVAVNQTGVFLGMKEFGPRMASAGGGSVVNVSSIFSSGGGFGNGIAYHATKGAVAAMSKNAAVFWGAEGVRVNSLHPGFVATPMSLQHQDLPLGDITLGEGVLRRTPVGRMAEPREIAPMVEFLLSPRSNYATGGEFYVDGGWNAY